MKNSKILKSAVVALILLGFVACGASNQVRTPKKAVVDVANKRSILVVNDTTIGSTDRAKTAGVEGFRAALLKGFDTVLILPKIEDKFKNIPKNIADGAIKKDGNKDAVSAADALSSAEAALLKELLKVLGKVGAFDQVVFIHTEGVEGELAPVPGVKNAPKKYTVTVKGAVYDVAGDKVIVAASEEDSFPLDTYLAKYPLLGDEFATFLITGK